MRKPHRASTKTRAHKELKARNKAKRYLAHKERDGIRLNERAQQLREQPRCGTILGGTRIWLRGKRSVAPFESYKFPIIADGTKCNEPAKVSRRRDGKNEHRCAKHIGVDWVPDA